MQKAILAKENLMSEIEHIQINSVHQDQSTKDKKMLLQLPWETYNKE